MIQACMIYIYLHLSDTSSLRALRALSPTLLWTTVIFPWQVVKAFNWSNFELINKKVMGQGRFNDFTQFQQQNQGCCSNDGRGTKICKAEEFSNNQRRNFEVMSYMSCVILCISIVLRFLRTHHNTMGPLFFTGPRSSPAIWPLVVKPWTPSTTSLSAT